MNKVIMLEEEYQLVRIALISAGIEMSDSVDALYRDWHRWRKSARAALKKHGSTKW